MGRIIRGGLSVGGDGDEGRVVAVAMVVSRASLLSSSSSLVDFT